MFTTRPKQALAYGDLKQLAGRARFVALHHLGGIAEKNGTDFRFLEVKRETKDAAREFDHLVQHHVAQSFDAGDTVAGFADDADVALRRRGLQPRDLRFDFFKDGAHRFALKLLLEALQTVAHAAVPDVTPHTNPHSAQQFRVDDELSGEVVAVFAFQVRDHLLSPRLGASSVALSIVALRFSISRRRRRL